MDLHQHLRLMSDYHRWALQRLYDAVDQLSDVDYHSDVKLFFCSVHGTLNHILLVDHVWQARLKKTSFSVISLDQELERDRAALKQRVLDFASSWRDFVDELAPEQIAGDLDFRTMKGENYCMPFSSLILHVFNHATHHRGQISTALTQFGLEAPVMDFPYFLVGLPRERLHSP